jgi:3-hydroxymyristoyl/3-hydroxydecanoyl-(acyl carrier protein) dehydratase
MSNIIKALKQRLRICEPLTSDVFLGSLVFDPDFPGFQGHFPGNPILPGVCLIEAAVQLISCGSGRNLLLAELERVKFFSPVKPGDEVKLEFHIEHLPDGVGAKGTMMSGQRKICAIKLKLTGEKS